MQHIISTNISQEGYKLTDKPTIKNLEDILKIFSDNDEVKPVLIGGMAVAAYIHYYTHEKYRNTNDIDFIIDKNKKIDAKEIIYRKSSNLSIKERIIFGYDGIKIEYEYGPSISILFKDEEVPYNEIELKLGKNKIKLYVAKMEYLLVDKIFTYLNRKEEKDLNDIKVLAYLMKTYGYDRELLYEIFSEYSKKYKKYASKAKDIIEEEFL